MTDTSATTVNLDPCIDTSARAGRFAEGPLGWAERQVLGLAYALKPNRAADALPLALATMMDLTRGGPRAPDASSLRSRPPGFAGVVRDLSTPALLEGMRRGFYPHAHIGPLKWWSPPERAVVPVAEVHLAKRFRRTLRTTDLSMSFDRAFDDVMLGCAARRPGRPHLTWLRPGTLDLYARLHDEGHAHSVEIWDAEGALVGGLFGVALGPVFSALSMFHSADNASKIGIVSLYHHLAEWGFTAVDHQMMSPWVETLGGRVLPRDDYAALVAGPGPALSEPGRWQAVFTPRQTAEWVPPAAPVNRDAA